MWHLGSWYKTTVWWFVAAAGGKYNHANLRLSCSRDPIVYFHILHVQTQECWIWSSFLLPGVAVQGALFCNFWELFQEAGPRTCSFCLSSGSACTYIPVLNLILREVPRLDFVSCLEPKLVCWVSSETPILGLKLRVLHLYYLQSHRGL